MTKIRKVLLLVLAVCMTICVGIAVAACDNDGIINKDKKYSYTVTLTSQGGLPLQGVTVSLEKDGMQVAEPLLTDAKGQAVLETDELDEYDVKWENLPAGYTLSPGAKTKIKADTRELTIKYISSVIDSPAPAGTKYKVGDVIHNFSFTDAVTGEIFSLAYTLTHKKAVLLNFWGTMCNPCRAEFPAMQEAYEEYSDKLEIFALSSYALSDTASQIANFKTSGGYTFPMGLDHGAGTANEYSYFDMSGGYPTSVIIDRFGVIAYKSSGSETSPTQWKATFERFTKNDYSQSDIDISEEGGFQLVKRPEGITHPDSAAIAQAINGDGIGDKLDKYFFDDVDEDQVDWYWDIATVDGRSVLRPNNYATDKSFAAVYFTVNLKPGEGLQYDYNVNTLSERNILNVFIDGKRTVQHYNTSGGWQTYREFEDGTPFYIATRTCTVEIGFLYLKASDLDTETPVYIDNITVYDATQLGTTKDLAYSPVEGLALGKDNKYDVDIALGEDGIYHYNYKNNSGATESVILFADILNVTYWADRHIGSNTFQTQTVNEAGVVINSRDTSLYDIYAWYFNQSLRYQSTDFTTPFNNAFYLQQFSETLYVPVTKQLQEALVAFTKLAYEYDYSKACGEDNVFGKDEYPTEALQLTDTWYEDQWIELCYYFLHYGPDHKAGDKCFKNFNTSQGLTFELPNEAHLGNNEVNITKPLSFSYDRLNAGGGIKFTFTPEENGIYIFSSTHSRSDESTDTDGNYTGVDPDFMLYDLSTGRLVVSNNDDNRINHLDTYDFFAYVELKAGVTYGITACLNYYQDIGKYTMQITKSEGDSLALLQYCSSSGMQTWYADADGNPTDADGNPSETYIYYHTAIKTALNPDTGYYHQYLRGGEFGSVIYINFLAANYYWTSGETLYMAMNSNSSPLSDSVKAVLRPYYEKSIEGKDESDELYGFTEATPELVNTLMSIFEEPVERDWERFACYYVYYNASNN